MSDENHDFFELEERADFIDEENLMAWDVEVSLFKKIRKELLQHGSRLISGPRGTGKTHQMRITHERCLIDKNKPLSLYVSYGKYMRLEPLLTRSTEAISLFHIWVLGRILNSGFEWVEKTGLDNKKYEDKLEIGKKELEALISELQKGTIQQHTETSKKISIEKTIDCIEWLYKESKRKRAILLLDDAALQLAPDYLVEFFDIFRSIKTNKISPKASVYPGTTEYGPRFHVGHDALRVNAWLDADTVEYSDFMTELINKRFKKEFINVPNDYIEIFKLSSFGIPRTFIGLLYTFSQTEGHSNQEKFNKVINERASMIESEYLSLHEKVKQYKSIIEIGHDLFTQIVDKIVEVNHKGKNEKILVIGIQKEKRQDFQINQMFKFLVEAGLLYDEIAPVKHGEDRIYTRYRPHLLFLIKNRIYSKSRGLNTKKALAFFKRKSSKHPIRSKIDNFITDRSKVKLDLPACINCGEVRIAPEQRFCHNCGTPLVRESIFLECLKLKICDLPISEYLKSKVGETDIRTIEDILGFHDPSSVLRKVSGIGPKRSEKIIKTVKSKVAEFVQ